MPPRLAPCSFLGGIARSLSLTHRPRRGRFPLSHCVGEGRLVDSLWLSVPGWGFALWFLKQGLGT